MLRFSVALAFSTVLLVACGASAQPGNSVANVVPSAALPMSPTAEAKGHPDCSGTHGVKVHPCPVVLKKTKYVAVSASGPGIYEESWGPKPCQPFCKFSKVKLNEIRVYPDRKCGTASVVIYGYNGADQLVGKAYFNVTNDECKHAR
jgi:hypothetical protein